MNFNLAATDNQQKLPSLLEYLRLLTDDARWQQEPYSIPPNLMFRLPILPGDHKATAFIYACHAIGATKLEPPNKFTAGNRDADVFHTTNAFRLSDELESSGRTFETRLFLRVLVSHEKTKTYEGEKEHVEETVELTCVCDDRGNIFRQNEKKFTEAYQQKLAELAKPDTTPSAQLELRIP